MKNMTKRERDYSNLKETERVWDAVKLNNTHVKDYSLTHLVCVSWGRDDEQTAKRRIHLYIGMAHWVGVSTDLWHAINTLVGDADEAGWLPRQHSLVFGDHAPLSISTLDVNQECLQDHVAKVSIGSQTAILDLEELLKATRYA